MDNQQVSQKNQFSIPGMPGYWVDTSGNIFSNKRGKIKQLNPYTHKGRGHKLYLRVKINGKLQLVHRVCASAYFNIPIENIDTVNHIDANTLNNVYENLELASHHEQVAHAVQNGLYCSGEEWYKARGLSSNG